MSKQSQPKIEDLEAPTRELSPEEAAQAGGGFFSKYIQAAGESPLRDIQGAGDPSNAITGSTGANDILQEPLPFHMR